jgi:hypothetical protein
MTVFPLVGENIRPIRFAIPQSIVDLDRYDGRGAS